MVMFLIEGINYAQFFSRIVNALPEQKQKDAIFVSRDRPICEFVKHQLPQCQVIQIPIFTSAPVEAAFRQSSPRLAKRLGKSLEECFEYVVGGGEREVCWQVLMSCFVFISQFDPATISRVVMCSGCGIGAKAAKAFCEMTSIPTQFVELANLPDKIFVDPEGTNAHSRLAMTPEILDRYPAVDEGMHQSWMAHYHTFKSRPPRQALGNALADVIEASSQHKVLNTGIPYLFVPLQVSTDAQLWLYSDFKNEDVIRYALHLAEQRGYHVVVKIHPAEPKREEVQHIVRLQQTLGFMLSNELTTELIKQSEEVVTINSTVGLEGLLLHKPVTAIGHCFYKTFDYERLKKYIHYYLFDGVDFFSNEPIARNTAIAFLNR
jgi:Capsule polysaccharide export protein